MHKLVIQMVAILLAANLSYGASKVAYWRFDGGAPGDSASVLVSDYNTPTLDGVAEKSDNNGAIPIYSDDIPAAKIYAYLGGPVLNAANNSSLRFVNTGLPDDVNSKLGGVVLITGDQLLQLTDLTVETFIKMDRKVNYALAIGFSRADSGCTGWNIDFDDASRPRLRLDTHGVGVNIGPPRPDGWNETVSSSVAIDDGQWHHLAFTYDNSMKKAKLYIDGVVRAERNTHSNLVYNPGGLRIGHGAGGRAFDGWLDEVVISDAVLGPSEFMTVVTTSDTRGYWSFEDGEPGDYAETLNNDFYAPLLHGTASAMDSGSVKPAFSSEIPFGNACFIYDGVDGERIRTNTGSLLFSNKEPLNPSSYLGSTVKVSGDIIPEKMTNFTAEAFIKVRNKINFAQIVGKQRASTGGHSWSLAINSDGNLRARFDTHTPPNNEMSDGFNQSLESNGYVSDGNWHHVALTYDGDTRKARLYVDYGLVKEETLINQIKLDSGTINIGAGDRAFDGWIDELRLTDKVLAPEQFLRARPPTGTTIMVQ